MRSRKFSNFQLIFAKENWILAAAATFPCFRFFVIEKDSKDRGAHYIMNLVGQFSFFSFLHPFCWLSRVEMARQAELGHLGAKFNFNEI